MPIYAIDGIAPELPPDGNFYIAPDAVLIGRVRIMTGASVWFGAVLRGDNDWITVGQGSNVQDLSVIHTDPGQPVIIGANVTIGHRVIVHSAIVGDNSLIGMGATLLNMAHIGRDTLVGANALVTEGKSFADGSLVIGAPARVARALDADAIARIRVSAEIYQANARRYRKGLKPV